MPKKPDPSFDDEFQDDEILENDFEDDDTSDESDGDDEYDEDYDEEYDEDYDDDEAPKGSWVKKALFATIGLGVVGVGAYFVLNNFMPASKPAADNGPYANPGGLGKVVKATPIAQEAAATETTTEEATVAASPVPEATKAPVAAKPAVTAEPVQEAVATPAPRVAAKKVTRQVASKRWSSTKTAKRWVAKKRIAQKPQTRVAQAMPKTSPGGHFTLQVGAFAQLSNAESLVKTLNAKGIPARMSGGGQGTTVSTTGTYAVRSTVVNSRAKADQLVNSFSKSGHPSILVAQGSGKYSVQLGVFSSRDRAQALATELKQKGMFVSINAKTVTHRQSNGGGLCKVFAGDYSTMEAAQKAMAQLRAQNIPAVVARQ